jgi:hypothetical protein
MLSFSGELIWWLIAPQSNSFSWYILVEKRRCENDFDLFTKGVIAVWHMEIGVTIFVKMIFSEN